MISAFWEMFKPLYAVDTLEGYTENEIVYLKELFGALPQVLEDYYRAAGRTKAFAPASVGHWRCGARAPFIFCC